MIELRGRFFLPQEDRHPIRCFKCMLNPDNHSGLDTRLCSNMWFKTRCKDSLGTPMMYIELEEARDD